MSFRRFSIPQHRFWLLNIAVALLYFGLARSGLLLATLQANASPVWPAAGFAIAIVYLFGARCVFGVALGALFASDAIGTPLAVTFTIAFASCAEALIGAWILRRHLRRKGRFAYQREAIAVAAAAAIGALISASLGTLALHSNHVIHGDLVRPVWFTWWMGDLIGGLIFIPIVLGLSKISFEVENPFHIFGASCSAIAALYFVFYHPQGSSFLFLVFPIILYAAYALNETYTLGLSLAVCGVSVAATVSAHGPFATGDLNERMTDLQIFLAALAATTLAFRGFQRARLPKLPIVVPLACWAVTGALFYSFDHSEKSARRAEMKHVAQHAVEAAQTRLDAYRDALHGGAGLYKASKAVSLEDWRDYNESVRIAEKYPGIMGLGVIWRVKTKDSADHYVIKYIEPLEPNREFLGRDVGTEFERRAAANQARDSGEIVVTPKIAISYAGSSFAGFWMLYPIYKNGSHPETIEQRRQSLLGWVYAPVSLERYFSSLAKDGAQSLDLRVFEGDRPDREPPVFKTENDGRFVAEFAKVVHIGPQTYLFEWRRRPDFIQRHNSALAPAALFGALFSLLLTGLIVNLRIVAQDALDSAQEASAEVLQIKREIKEAKKTRLDKVA